MGNYSPLNHSILPPNRSYDIESDSFKWLDQAKAANQNRARFPEPRNVSLLSLPSHLCFSILAPSILFFCFFFLIFCTAFIMYCWLRLILMFDCFFLGGGCKDKTGLEKLTWQLCGNPDNRFSRLEKLYKHLKGKTFLKSVSCLGCVWYVCAVCWFGQSTGSLGDWPWTALFS